MYKIENGLVYKIENIGSAIKWVFIGQEYRVAVDGVGKYWERFDIIEGMYIRDDTHTEPFPGESMEEILALYQAKLDELNTARDDMIYGTFQFEGKTYDCSQRAREDITDFVFAYKNDQVLVEVLVDPSDPNNTETEMVVMSFEGMHWYTSGGAELIFIPAEKAISFKMAVINLKAIAFAKFNNLFNTWKGIDLNASDVVEQINAIQW